MASHGPSFPLVRRGRYIIYYTQRGKRHSCAVRVQTATATDESTINGCDKDEHGDNSEQQIWLSQVILGGAVIDLYAPSDGN
jgi:hypothetical protein